MAQQRPNKQAPIGNTDQTLWFVALGALMVLMIVCGMAWIAAAIGGLEPGNPAVWLIKPPTGQRWNTAASVALGFETLAVGGLVTPFVVFAVKARRNRMWTDDAAAFMSSRKDVEELTEQSVKKVSERLGHLDCGVGLPLGTSVAYHVPLFSTYEWSQVWVMGMRAGKTRSVAVPQLMAHKGPAVATSNKVDVHDLTRGPRSEIGRCWVNDPQQIVGEAPSWWWNPLSFVTTVQRAEQLVSVWAASRSDEETAASDPFFEPAGRALASSLILAAALSGDDLTRLSDWLTGQPPAPGVPDPVDILFEHGYDEAAKTIRNHLRSAPDQRSGVYGTAQGYFAFLRDPRYVAWVTPKKARTRPRRDEALTGVDALTGQVIGAVEVEQEETVVDDRPQLDLLEFIQSTDTLYLLSEEGAGSARAITGALVVALYAVAQEESQRRGGRLGKPMLFMLDEAANVCRWPDLCNVMSHAGGRGILLAVILQSVAQGEEVWGKTGWKKMWSNTNVLSVGRGVNDGDVLGDLAALIGDRQIRDQSLSIGTKGHRSTSTSIRSERILDVSDLRALPAGRAVTFVSGVRPILMATKDLSTYDWAWKTDASREYCTSERGSLTHA